MKKLHQLISEKESELQNLEDSLGLGFPIVEQAKMTQISHLRLELEDLRQIEKSIQLTDDQQVVLDGLKFIFVNYNQEFGTDGNIKYALRDFYWYLGTDYSILENKKLVSMCEAYDLLSADEFAQILAAFAEWGMKEVPQ